MARTTISYLVAGCLVALCATTAEACPTCKDNLAGDPTAEGLARGFYFSILFMVSMPFLILGSLCAYFYFLVRRAEWDKQQSARLDSQSVDLTAAP